jgi:hypothetical protein
MVKRIIIIPIILLCITFFITGFDLTKKENTQFDFIAESKEVYNFYVPLEDEVEFDTSENQSLISLDRSYIGFKEAVGFKESGGKYKVVNRFGYLGKYQFSQNTLKMLGFKNIDNFLNDTHQQELAFQTYVSYNKWVLRKEIERYVGQEINGVEITESGIVAAAHLAGPGNVRKFLKSKGNHDSQDANGDSVKYYMEMFSDYDISGIKAAKRF